MKRALILLLLFTGTAHADVANEVWLGSFGRALHTTSANALTGDSLVGGTFGYARLLPLRPLPKLELWAAGNFLGGAVTGEMFQTLDTKLQMLQFSAGVRGRYPLWRRLVWANAKLDAGAHRARITLEDMTGHSASDSGWGAMTTAALGVEVTPLALKRVGFGVRFELGYVAASSIDMNARSEGAPDGTNELDRMAASLGHLDISGRYASFTLHATF